MGGSPLVPQGNTGRDLRHAPVRGLPGCGILGPPAPRNCPLCAGRTMATPKPRILPWLVSQLDNGQLEGVAWLNESHTRFRIPWKHGLRHDAQQQDFGIFQVRGSRDSANKGRGGLRGHWTEKAGLAQGAGPRSSGQVGVGEVRLGRGEVAGELAEWEGPGSGTGTGKVALEREGNAS